ncbi:MAG: 3-dehydroquinate synthase [Lachnospiraceae bacterium]|jgi:3-dehydroquinate synthase|nr:3-dehydroquinate synthase [Lachnospiraceae bacterium]
MENSENGLKRLSVNKDHKFAYDIVYSDSFDYLYDEISALPGGWKKIAVITDSNVGPLYADAVCAALAKHDLNVGVFTIPAGEENKTLDTVRSIYSWLIENHYDRKSLLVSLGGGVPGDITGFAAATFLRGIDFIQVPTTLLAQADSSIGGKTGVDFDGYKNMVGAFYMPKLVFTNVSVLKTLDGRQFASGFAEIMKHGLIRDEDYYEWLIDNMYEIRDRDPGTLTDMLYTSNVIKKNIVEADPFEKKERMLLNFGHTLGHAIEKYKNFSLTHGECVALGCVAASYISWKKDFLSMEEYYEIRDLFVPFGLPISIEDIDIDEIIKLAHSDKKSLNGNINFILIKKVGKAFISTDVTDDEMRAALSEILYREDAE